MGRVLVVLAVVMGLAGCASVRKQQLSPDGYVQYAKPLMMVGLCSHQGFIPPDLAASGMRHIRAGLDQTIYDQDKLVSLAARLAETNAPPTQGDCNDLAVQISQANQERDANIAQSKADAQEMADLTKQLQNSVPAPVYCNRLGTQTFCN